jgi:cell division protein FtsB
VDHSVDPKMPKTKEAKAQRIDAVDVTFTEQFAAFVRRNLMWFLVAGLTLLVLQDIFGTHGVLAMRRSQQQAADIQKEIDQLNQENQKLQDRARSLKSDPTAIERIAREEIGLARPGEYIFKIPSTSGDSQTPATQAPAQPKKH